MSEAVARPAETVPSLTWAQILRLGLAQAALGAIVVITTSVLNRVLVVELAFPASLAGLFLAVNYSAQALRPRWGHGLDRGGRVRLWIIGGIALLGLGSLTAAFGVALSQSAALVGAAVTALGYLMVGIGGGAAGTTVLAFLAIRTAPERRAEAASLTWVLMIAGIIISSIMASVWLAPFSLERLIWVTACISLAALALTILAVGTLDDRRPARSPEAARTPFMTALRTVWAEPDARLFTVFIFVSMVAYNFQELIFEPFGGHAFGLDVSETAFLTSLHQMGVLAGMVGTPLLGRLKGGWTGLELRRLTIAGCIGSAAALAALAVGGGVGPEWPLQANAALLGLANGVFAVAAIGSMMALAGSGSAGREGVRMGLWGAAQGIAFGVGGVAGAVTADIGAAVLGDRTAGYGPAFLIEAALFIAAAAIAARIRATASDARRVAPPAAPEPAL